MNYSKVYKTVADSVVNVIQVDVNGNIISTGSGMIIDDGKKVLTCSHCCSTTYKTCLYEKESKKIIEGIILFNDQIHDIAILEFPISIGKALLVGDSKCLEIGNEIFTIGFPYAFGSERTLTVGHVAAFENDLIKIDTSVNNGNSGGPLFNTRGEIVGVVNAKLGRLSAFLESIEKQKPKASMMISGVDPVQVIQQMIREMQQNLNLGIGYAIPIHQIASYTDIIKSLHN